MINALIQIVQSKSFISQWTDEERVNFKNFFFEWLKLNWKLVVTHGFLVRKLQSLMNALYQSIVLAEFSKESLNQSIGINPTHQPLGGNIFAEFIQIFLQQDNYPQISQIIAQLQPNVKFENVSEDQLNLEEFTAISMFAKFILETINECMKTVINWNMDEEGDDPEDEAADEELSGA